MDEGKSYSRMRRSYEKNLLRKADLNPDPMDQFLSWMEDALQNQEIKEANIMTLGTATLNGQPSIRLVLFKGIDDGRLLWYTNYRSRKGLELDQNPHAALLFFWEPLERQIRIEGTVSRLSEDKSDKYFAERPRGSQIAASISPQSEVIKLSELEASFEKMEKECRGEEITRPSSWGGYALLPERWEFWQGRPNRLHDRFTYERADGLWKITRLGP